MSATVPQKTRPRSSASFERRARFLALCLCVGTASCVRPLANNDDPQRERACFRNVEFRNATQAYFEIGDELAQDSLTSVTVRARKAQAILEPLLAGGLCAPHEQDVLRELLVPVKAIADTQNLAEARRHYSDWSRVLIETVAQTPESRGAYHLLRCTMTEGYNKWMQAALPLRNPYQGQAMYSCGSQVQWSQPPENLASTSLHLDESGDDIAHYVCPMHPSVRSNQPDRCPLCGMDLVPVTRTELSEGAIIISEDARRDAGVLTRVISRSPMHKTIRALATVQVDRTRQNDVALRFAGFIEKAWVVDVGVYVQRGDPLFSIYSPELYAAQKEYLEAVRSSSTATLSSVSQSARNRLRLAGLTDPQIDDVRKRNEPFENITWFAPVSGYVLEQHVVQGARVELGQTLYRIAPLDRVWIEGEIHEQDLPHLQVGTPVRLRPAFAPAAGENETVEAVLSYLSPNLHPVRRTRIARVVLPSPTLKWLPGSSVEMVFDMDLGARLQVPKSAVVHTGPRKIVFIDVGDDKLRPREIRTGAANAESYEVLGGVEENERVVTAGTFLVSSESRLRDAAPTQSHSESPAQPAGADVSQSPVHILPGAKP